MTCTNLRWGKWKVNRKGWNTLAQERWMLQGIVIIKNDSPIFKNKNKKQTMNLRSINNREWKRSVYERE